MSLQYNVHVFEMYIIIFCGYLLDTLRRRMFAQWIDPSTPAVGHVERSFPLLHKLGFLSWDPGEI